MTDAPTRDLVNRNEALIARKMGPVENHRALRSGTIRIR